MQTFKITQNVKAENKAAADIVASRMKYNMFGEVHQESFGTRTVEPQISAVDGLVRKIIAGVVIYQFSKAMKNWAQR